MKLPRDFKVSLQRYTYGWCWGKECIAYHRRYRREPTDGRPFDAKLDMHWDAEGRRAIWRIDDLVDAIEQAPEENCEHYVSEATYVGTVEKITKGWRMHPYEDVDSDATKLWRKVVWDVDPRPGADSIIEELERVRGVQYRFSKGGRTPFLTFSSGRGLYLVGHFFDTARNREEWRPIVDKSVVERIWLLVILEFGLLVDMGVAPHHKARVTKVPYTWNWKTKPPRLAFYISRQMREEQVLALNNAPEMPAQAHYDFPEPMEYHELLEELDRPEMTNEQLNAATVKLVKRRREGSQPGPSAEVAGS